MVYGLILLYVWSVCAAAKGLQQQPQPVTAAKEPTREDHAKLARKDMEEELRIAEYLTDPETRAAAKGMAESKFRQRIADLMK